MIGNPLKSSPDFPPLHTVHAAFTAHGVPSEMNFNSFKHNLHTSLQHGMLLRYGRSSSQFSQFIELFQLLFVQLECF